MDMALETLKSIQNVWNLNNFPDMIPKPKQVKCLEAKKFGKDVIAVLPTGYGKSILYQLLPDFFSNKKSTILVVTALNSIIEDQVNYLNSVGISSFVLNARDDALENSMPSLF